MVQTKRADFNGLAKELSVSPVSVRIMRNRGMETKEAMERYLYGTLDGLYDGALMKNMGEAVAVLISSGRKSGSGSSGITISTASAPPTFF